MKALLLVLVLLLGLPPVEGGQPAASHRPTARPIKAKDYWPIEAGRAWTFTDTSTGGWTKIEVQSDGHTMSFTRSDNARYWGNGAPHDLNWHVVSDWRGVHANNPAGTFGLDEHPDEMWTNRVTGAVDLLVWHLQADNDIPYRLLPATFPVPSQIRGTNRYYFRWSNGSDRYSPDIPWTVSYQWDQGRLRVMFDEGLYDGTWIHEDWYFERWYGPVQIEQWEDFARTTLRLRIAR